MADSDFSAFAESLDDTLDDNTDGTATSTQTPDNWQAKLETLLDPRTGLAQRQILASELLSSNSEIRESVQTALRDRKVRELQRKAMDECFLDTDRPCCWW